MNKKQKKEEMFEKYLPVIKNAWMEEIEHINPNHFQKYFDKKEFKNMLDSTKKYNTPQFFLNNDLLKKRAKYFKQSIQKNIPNSEFFYACKCNDFPYIIKSLHEEGYNADVAGLLELKIALKLNIKKIIFTSPYKTDEELILAIKNRDRIIINIDNFDEITNIKRIIKNKFNNINEKIKISIRLNPVSSVMGSWSKFGIELKDLKKAIDKIFNKDKESKYFELIGLQFHCSWNKTPKKYLENIEALGQFFQKYKKEKILSELIKNIEFLDIGGGFFPEDTAIIDKIQDKGILFDMISEIQENNDVLKDAKDNLDFNPYDLYLRKVDKIDTFSKEIAKSLENNIFPLNKKIKIYFEPGRYLVTHSTTILTKVTAIKDNNVIVDAGINMVGSYRFEEHLYAPIVNISKVSNKYNKTIIYGSLCDPSDLFGYHYFGKEIKKGDILAILHQGAYTNAMAWHFIRPLPKYIVSDNGKNFIGREEETFEQKYNSCKF